MPAADPLPATASVPAAPYRGSASSFLNGAAVTQRDLDVLDVEEWEALVPAKQSELDSSIESGIQSRRLRDH